MGKVDPQMTTAAELMPTVDLRKLEQPKGLDESAAYAWRAIVSSLGPTRLVSHGDVLSLEAACKAWSRWRLIDQTIAQLREGDAKLDGEIAETAKGGLEISALRKAANEAFREFNAIASAFGISMPVERMTAPVTDLFGNPVREGKGERGRPAFQPTVRDRDRVRLLLAMGWDDDRIAGVLAVSVPTLKKYFAEELKERLSMRDRLDARRLEVAAEGMNDGNITALRELNKLIEKNDLHSMADRARRGGATAPAETRQKPARSAKVGKKEALKAAAKTAGEGTAWGNLLKPGFGGRVN